ncbi:MAG: sugar ABC transporter permease [Chloroflexota bacterium]
MAIAQKEPLSVTDAPVKVNKQKTSWTPYYFLAPPLIIYLIWIIGPVFYTFYLSLTDWDGISPRAEFIGLENFQRLFGSIGSVLPSAFEYSLYNNLVWLLVFITVPTAIGLGLAILLNQGLPGERMFKVGIFLPQVLSFAVIALIWSWVYNPRAGILNELLLIFGWPEDNLPGWLADKELAIWSVIFAAAWRQIGYIMILYVAGLKNVPPTLMEAAEVDGANAWQRFWRITFPLLTPVTTIVIVISIIDSLRSFDLVQIMTRGGPANSTSVLANLMYIQAFNNYKFGLGAATAVVLFAISLVFIVVYLWRVMQDELEF